MAATASEWLFSSRRQLRSGGMLCRQAKLPIDQALPAKGQRQVLRAL